MPCPTCAPGDARPDAEALNQEIRAFTAGRSVWSAEDLVELARLQAEWRAAVEAERGVRAGR